LSKCVENRLASLRQKDSLLPQDPDEDDDSYVLNNDPSIVIMSEEEAEEMQLSVATVWASCRKQLYMTNSQLSHFHAEKGTLVSKFSQVKSRNGMLTLVRDFLHIFQFSVKKNNISLKVNLADYFPRTMFLDTQRYLEILLHLVVNAIKFARKVNSYIHIMISCEKITDEEMLKQGWVCFMKTEVFDNGVGIEKDKQEKLFYTFKAEQKDMTHGVGIGLSTVRAVT